VVGLAVTGCGGDPPQIVDYAPQRNTIDVSTAAPIRITFDHDVDQASVASRLRLAPATIGSVRWLSGRQLIFDHVTLLTNTNYEVILESGYRDPAGNTYTLRHHWSFVTEGPPGLTSSKPASRETGVDPSAYLSLQFSRGMDPVHLKDAISIQRADHRPGCGSSTTSTDFRASFSMRQWSIRSAGLRRATGC